MGKTLKWSHMLMDWVIVDEGQWLLNRSTMVSYGIETMCSIG